VPSRSNNDFLFCINCAGNPNQAFVLNLTGTHNNEATVNDKTLGPVFGGRDLSIGDVPGESAASSSALGYSYRCPLGDYKLEACQKFLAGSRQFKVQDYETFTLRIPSLLSLQHQTLVSTWVASAEVEDAAGTEGYRTGTLATRCYSFVESGTGQGGTFEQACRQDKTIVVALTDDGFLFGGYAGVRPSATGVASKKGFLFCLNCAGKPGEARQLKHIGGAAGSAQEPGVAVRAPNSAPGFGLVPVQASVPLDLELHISAKGNLAQGKSNLGEAFACPASSAAGCLTYLAGEQYFDVVEYQAFEVRKEG